MNEISNSWTAEQRHNMDARLHYDKLLADGGARYSELGYLALTDEQLESAQATGDPLTLSIEINERQEFENQKAEWLETDVDSAKDNGLIDARTYNILMRHGATTRRDVLVAGRYRLMDMRNFGAGSLSHVEAWVSNDEYGLSLEDEPDVRFIASICKHLSDVTGLVVGRYLGKNSLKDILDMSEEDRYSTFSWLMPYYATPTDKQTHMKNIYEHAKWIADEFRKYHPDDIEH